MVQLIFEQLANGTPPASIPANIASHAAIITPGAKVVELPSLDFVRRCRPALRVLCETLAAYRLDTAKEWEQLFTDGTGRRQVALQNLVLSIIEDDEIQPLVLSTSIILEDETSERQVEAIVEMISTAGQRLERWTEVMEEMYPDYIHNIPDPSSMNIGKLGYGGALTTDTCNGARKTRRLLVDLVKTAAEEMMAAADAGTIARVLEVDCWNHLRNVWLGGVIKSFSAFLNAALRNDLDEIDPRLRVSTSMDSVLRAVDREFSLCANYPKGHGDLFRGWIEENHPGAMLLHVERASGSRQDLSVEGAGAVYWNRKYWIEFLDERLRLPGDNVLQENLFVVLSSLHMVALARVCSILHLAVCLPMRWLAGNSHTLHEYDWSVRCMGQAADLLEAAMEEVKVDGARLLEEDFAMGIFDKLVNKLPPLSLYLTHMYEVKAMAVIGGGDKAFPFSALRAELFSPSSQTNKDSTVIATSLASVAAASILSELRDEKKATASYLSSLEGVFSWGQTSAIDHAAGMRKKASNDDAERAFGNLTSQLQFYGRVGLGSAGGVSQARANGDLSRGHERRSQKKKSSKGKVGTFHLLPEQMRLSLIAVAMKDAAAARKADQAALSRQRAAKQQKEKLAKERAAEAKTEEYIDSLYYRDMYASEACWMTPAAVDAALAKLSSKAAKLRSLKENIRMRTIGLGWKEYSTAWSKDGVEHTPEYLANHLKNIIQLGQSKVVPDEPPVAIPTRKALPKLGSEAADVAAMDSARRLDESDLKDKARRIRLEREAAGIGDRYELMQPASQPAIDGQLVGKRLEVLCEYDMLEEEDPGLAWCQGLVVAVSDGTNLTVRGDLVLDGTERGRKRAVYTAGEAVRICWDANEEMNEESTEQNIRLLPSKWNPKNNYRAGCWRFDLSNSARLM
mmetsp:Transcript_13403/g.29103  ORF Transcript_13403/g.29103 Transcript_13403/m.29103 type:complete len:910 (+) Transcript_13403:516-3245(+)